MDKRHTEAQRQLEMLRRRYLQQLPQTTREMSDAWDLASSQNHLMRDTLRALHQMAHKLKGSGESFDLPEVSRIAARLEDVLEAFVVPGKDNAPHFLERGVPGTAPTMQQQAYISRLLADLKFAAAAACRDDADEEPAGSSPDASAAASSPLEEQSPLILVVDDSEALRRKVAISLEAEGFRVVEAENGQEAVEQVQRHHPDLVLMDVMMPVMDGFEAQRRIRDDETLKGIPIIFLSGLKSITMAEIQKALQHGVQGYLPKPSSMPWIVEKVTACLLEKGEEDAPEAVDGGQLMSARILIADDSEWMRQKIALGLRQHGFEVIEAENGLMAVEEVRQHHPDLVLMDVMMPVMNGFEAQRRIRDDEALKDIPIIFLTGRNRPEEVEQAKKYGMQGYITKPTSIGQIMERVNAILTDA